MKQFFPFSKWPSLLIFSGLLIFSSCKKDNNNTKNPDPLATIDAAQSDVNVSVQFDDVFNITMGVQASDAGEDIGLGTGGGIIYKVAGPGEILSPDSTYSCFTVSVVPRIPRVFPKVVTIDFGSGCVGKDGKLRKGKIITVFTGPMLVSGSKASTTFDGYNVDSFKIEGTHTIENTSTSNSNAWTVKIIGGKVTNTQNGNWRKLDGVREHKQSEGNSTPFNPFDDVYEIRGNASGSNSNGHSWTSLITEALIRKFTCPWIVSGKVKITGNSNISAILDYGNGTCDNQATITVNGIIYNIALR